VTYQGGPPPAAAKLPEPGWLPDPARTDLERYWNGWSWTSRTRDRVTKIERVLYNPAAYSSTTYNPAPWAPAKPKRRSLLGPLLALLMVVLLAYGVLGYLGRLPASAPYAQQLEQSEPTAPTVDYPIFGSTELVQYVARAMVAQEESIDVSYWLTVGGVSEQGLTDALLEAGAQNPYIYADSWTVVTQGPKVWVEPDYTYSGREAEGRRVATQAAVTSALASLHITAATPAREAIKAIHDYLASHATYDHTAYQEILADSHADSLRVDQSQEAYGILVAGTAVCNGYAKAFQAMAQAAGLQTVIVTGTATGLTTGGHAWNRVLVDGQWLTVDVTWDDADGASPTRYDYFLVDNNAAVLGSRTADLDWVVDQNLGNYGSVR